MFWINAMAANIFFKFTSMKSSSADNEKVKFIFYTLYSQVGFLYLYKFTFLFSWLILYHQGVPFLLCILIGLMDRFGSCDLLLPNMGVAQCFLGSPWGEQWEASYSNETNSLQWSVFFSSPEFLYFHSILMVLQASNIFFFLLTVYYLVDHWRNSAGIIKSETSGNFLVVLKLFFIMGKLLIRLCFSMFVPPSIRIIWQIFWLSDLFEVSPGLVRLSPMLSPTRQVLNNLLGSDLPLICWTSSQWVTT